MNIEYFNTGRQYTPEGQHIKHVYCTSTNTTLMADVSRNIAYEFAGKLTDWKLLTSYDECKGKCSWDADKFLTFCLRNPGATEYQPS